MDGDTQLSLAQQALEQRRQRRQHLATDLLAGFITSSLYASATYPLHRVKILLQTQDANPRIISGKVRRYAFDLSSFSRLVREQGLLALWRGNSAYLMRHVPSISMSFAFKDWFRAKLPTYDPNTQFWRALGVNALAGGAAGALALAAVYPFEFATVRMAADVGRGAERQYGKGMLQAWKVAVERDGLRSLYRGAGVACFSMMAYKSLYFGLYDTAKPIVFRSHASSDSSTHSSENLSDAEGESQAPLLAKLALASVTTCLAASITYPLDIIRKRLVVDVAADVRQYGAGSFTEAARAIWHREGLRGFYRFYSYDMVFRLGGGVLLVGYDILREGHGPVPPIAHTASKVMQAPPLLTQQQEQEAQDVEQQEQQEPQRWQGR